VSALDLERGWPIELDHWSGAIERRGRRAGWHRATHNHASRTLPVVVRRAGIAGHLRARDLSRLHFALIASDRYGAAGNRLLNAGLEITQHDAVMLAKLDDLAGLDIAHARYAGGFAGHAHNQRCLPRRRCGKRCACDRSRDYQY